MDGLLPKGTKRAGSGPSRMKSLAYVLWASMYLHPRKIRRTSLSVYEPEAPDSGYTYRWSLGCVLSPRLGDHSWPEETLYVQSPLAEAHTQLNSVVRVQSRLATGTVVVCALLLGN